MKHVIAAATASILLSTGASWANINLVDACRATVAVDNGRTPTIVEIVAGGGPIYHVAYTRDDGTRWEYACRIDGPRVTYAQDGGRWRDGPDWSIYRFEISRDRKLLRLMETSPDGEVKIHKFKASDFLRQ